MGMTKIYKKLIWWKVLICPIVFPLSLLFFVTMGNRCALHSPFIHTKTVFKDCIYKIERKF